MTWQDLLMTAGGFVLAASLVPIAFGPFRPGRSSSLPTSVALASYAVAMGTLSLWLTAAMCLTQASLWAVVAWRGPSSATPPGNR